ncbi:hypothetical protein VPHK436_0032 [Vibrio phage K436]
MKSKVEALQCVCGCEYEANTRLELLYVRLTAFNMQPLGCVDCSVESNTRLYVALESLTHINGVPLNSIIDGIAASVDWHFKVSIDEIRMELVFDVEPVAETSITHKD